MFRPIHHLLAKLRKAKAVRLASVRRAEDRAMLADREMRDAARALQARGMEKQDAVRQALADRLCGELGKPSFTIASRDHAPSPRGVRRTHATLAVRGR